MLEQEIQKLTQAITELTALIQKGAPVLAESGTLQSNTKEVEKQEDKEPKESKKTTKAKEEPKPSKKSEITDAHLQKVIASIYDNTDEDTVSFIDGQIDEALAEHKAEVLGDLSAEAREPFQTKLMEIIENKNAFVLRKTLMKQAQGFIDKSHDDYEERIGSFKDLLNKHKVSKLGEIELSKVVAFDDAMQKLIQEFSEKAAKEDLI